MSERQRRDDLRAADVDRTFVADILKRAVDEGRLTLHEYDDRLQQTYAARTYGELDKLVSDLPRPKRGAVVPVTSAVPAPAGERWEPVKPRPGDAGWLRYAWGAWFLAVSVNVVIWVIVSVTSGTTVYPWPLWVAGPWGAVLLATTIFGRHGDSRR